MISYENKHRIDDFVKIENHLLSYYSKMATFHYIQIDYGYDCLWNCYFQHNDMKNSGNQVTVVMPPPDEPDE